MKRTLVTLLLLIATVALYAADKPSFPGGDQALNKYLAENLHYPKQAQDNGFEGNVPIQFIVKADGTISSIKVTRMIDPDLEAEAIRLVREMPKWIPADNNGAPVDATANVVISFRLPE